jgi:hypothetical protein
MRIGDLPDTITEPFNTLSPDWNYANGRNTCDPLPKRAVNQIADYDYQTYAVGKSRDNADGTTYSTFGRIYIPLYTTYKELVEHKFNRKKINYNYDLDFSWKETHISETKNISANSAYNIWLLNGESESVNESTTENNGDHMLPYERCCNYWVREINGTRTGFRPVWKNYNTDTEIRDPNLVFGEEVDLRMVELYEDVELVYNYEYYYYEEIFSNFIGIFCDVSQFIGHNFFTSGTGFYGYRVGTWYYWDEPDRLTDLEINIMGKTFLGYIHMNSGNVDAMIEGKVTINFDFWEYNIN